MTGRCANTNNKASTVLEMFLDAILVYGIPSRVHGDCGGENQDIAIFMILLRGSDCGSFLWGSSTHNSHIERLWVEIGTQFACQWRAFFLWLETCHHLDLTNPYHLASPYPFPRVNQSGLRTVSSELEFTSSVQKRQWRQSEPKCLSS